MPVNFRAVAPQLVVADPRATAEYYRDVLGFEILSYFLDPPVYAMVRRGPVEIHFGKSDDGMVQTNETKREGLGSDVYIWVDDIEELFREFSASGADIAEGPVKRIYGSTEITVRDCDGHAIVFGD